MIGYTLDDGTVVRFEFEPDSGFRPVGPDEIVGKLRDAVGPAVEAARAVLARVREVGPDEIAVTFGIKVTGTMNWLVAKAASGELRGDVVVEGSS